MGICVEHGTWGCFIKTYILSRTDKARLVMEGKAKTKVTNKKACRVQQTAGVSWEQEHGAGMCSRGRGR